MADMMPPSQAPHYTDSAITLHHGDCLEVLRSLPDASVDAVVTDPPYGLEFMGKEWDAPWKASGVGRGARVAAERSAELTERGKGHSTSAGPYLASGMDSVRVAGKPFQEWCEAWARECLRVLKPGGHMLAFGGTRTWHRLACAVEDAGFEVRDSIAWLYGSGFPKSLDVSKAIDKAAPRADMFDAFATHYAEQRRASGLNHREVCEAGGFYAGVNHGGASTNWEKGYNVPTRAQWDILQPLLGLSDDWLPLIVRENAKREVLGQRAGSRLAVAPGQGMERGALDLNITAPATDAARTWQGWGTALKPAFEPIVVARKPLAGTVAANVLAHGTGALNIAACRVGDGEDRVGGGPRPTRVATGGFNMSDAGARPSGGRWPANVVLDESQAAALDEQSGDTTRYFQAPRQGDGKSVNGSVFGEHAGDGIGYSDSGGASRYFYVAKADASERVRVNGTAHPTVKPLALMRWLVRLVTPPGGTVLEPFAGSGTTVEACLLEGFKCIAIEREADYLPLIVQRVNRRRDPVEAVKAAGEDAGLFGLLDGEAS